MRGAPVTSSPRTRPSSARARARGDGRVREQSHGPRRGEPLVGNGEGRPARPPRCRRARRSRRRPRRSGGPWSGSAPCPARRAVRRSDRRISCARRRSVPTPRPGPGTRRRGDVSRASLMVSPTTLPAARSARSATWPRTSARARWRSASMSARACSRSRSISACVSATPFSRVLVSQLLGAGHDLLGLATGLGQDRRHAGPPRPRGRGEPRRRPGDPARCGRGAPPAAHPRARGRAVGDVEEDEEVGGGDDDPEEVDRQPASLSAFRGQPDELLGRPLRRGPAWAWPRRADPAAGR